MPKRILVSDLKGGESATLFEGRDHGSTVSCFLIHNSPGEGPGLHRHPYEETFIVQEGSATFTDGETERDVGAGNVVIIPAGEPHGFTNTGGSRLRQIDIHVADVFKTEWL